MIDENKPVKVKIEIDKQDAVYLVMELLTIAARDNLHLEDPFEDHIWVHRLIMALDIVFEKP